MYLKILISAALLVVSAAPLAAAGPVCDDNNGNGLPDCVRGSPPDVAANYREQRNAWTGSIYHYAHAHAYTDVARAQANAFCTDLAEDNRNCSSANAGANADGNYASVSYTKAWGLEYVCVRSSADDPTGEVKGCHRIDNLAP